MSAWQWRTDKVSYGNPSLGIAEDEIDAIIALMVLGARRARPRLLAFGRFDENGASVEVYKEIVSVSRRLRLTQFHFQPEGILLGEEPLPTTRYRGRIDFQVRVPSQFARYDDYFGVECKLLSSRQSAKARYYVRTGVRKFVDGTYSAGHPVAMLIGYVLQPRLKKGRHVAHGIDHLLWTSADLEVRILRDYVGASAFSHRRTYRDALIQQNVVPRPVGRPVRLLHAMLQMYP